MTGDIQVPNIFVSGDQKIYGGDYGSNTTNHVLILGTSGRDYWDFYEYGGDFRFYKSRSNQNTLVAQIKEDGVHADTIGTHTGRVKLDDTALVYESDDGNILFRYKDGDGNTAYGNLRIINGKVAQVKNMGNATTAANGTAGLVPAPTSAQYNYVLTGHGWRAKAPNATNAGTATYANKSGTATYATNSGTAAHCSVFSLNGTTLTITN